MLAEFQRTAPTNTTAYEHAWHKSMVESFENGLPPLPSHRNDARRRGAIVAPRTRAKTSERNAIHGNPTEHQSTTSAIHGCRNKTLQLQATLADTVSEIEALKKQVSALQHSRGRAGNSHDDKTTGRDGFEKSAHRDRSLGREGENNGSKRKAPSTSTETSGRRSVDNPATT